MVLLVEPDDLIASRLTASLDGVDEVRRCAGFAEARAQLRSTPPDLLVSNLRLSDYNGLQLVYLGTFAAKQTPAIIYTIRLDPTLAGDVQRAGAFYDTADCLVVSLRAYLGTHLPPAIGVIRSVVPDASKVPAVASGIADYNTMQRVFKW